MSTTDIFNEINAEKTNYTELQNLQPNIDDSQQLADDLNSSSKVAGWRLFVWIIASRIKDLVELFKQHKDVVEKRSKELVPGNTAWYQREALKFQYGDSLAWDQNTLQYSYPTENLPAKIVKLVSANEGSNNVVVVKAAKFNGSTPEELTAPELSSFQTYMNRVKFAGVRIEAVSRPADIMKINLKVYFDPLVINSDGSLISDASVFPVEDAINTYLKNLPFDGKFSVTELIDQIQLADGVVNPIFQSANAKYGSFAYAPITDYYNSNAGYIKIDPAFPLSNSINYVPQL